MKNNFKKTAREIKISKCLLNNKNLNIKIGTVEDRNSPETIYIFTSFWIRPKDGCKDVRVLIEKELDFLYKKMIFPSIKNSNYFANIDNNIFIKNIPENINYNNKRNFISFEVYIHTINSQIKDKKFPLSNKKSKDLFEETFNVVKNYENSDFLNSNKEFFIYSKS